MFVSVCIHVWSRRVLITSLHVHWLWISLLIEFSSKTDNRNITKKLIRYLCFISVGFIHSCHHRVKQRNFILEKNRLRSIDLTCCAINKPQRLRFLSALNTNSWNLKAFWSKSDRSHFENSPSFQISWTYSDVFQINEKIHSQLSAMFTCGKVGELSSQASKMFYKPPQAVYIASYKEPLDQSDCWKLFFFQLWNYTKYE